MYELYTHNPNRFINCYVSVLKAIIKSFCITYITRDLEFLMFKITKSKLKHRMRVGTLSLLFFPKGVCTIYAEKYSEKCDDSYYFVILLTYLVKNYLH